MAAAAAVVATCVSLVGTGFEFAGRLRQANEQYRQAKFAANQQKYQAQLNEQRANIAQIQGEQEEQKRRRQLSADVGSVYANWAGNGLMVDGGLSGDTLGSIVKSTATEAASDISNIKDNTAMKVWNYQANAAQQRASAKNILATGKSKRHATKVNAWFGFTKGVLWEAPMDGYNAYTAAGGGGGISGMASSIGGMCGG